MTPLLNTAHTMLKFQVAKNLMVTMSVMTIYLYISVACRLATCQELEL